MFSYKSWSAVERDRPQDEVCTVRSFSMKLAELWYQMFELLCISEGSYSGGHADTSRKNTSSFSMLWNTGAQNSVQCSRWTACSVWSHRSRSASHRQIVDSLRKGSYLSDGSFRVLHLWKVTESTQIHLKTKLIYCVTNKCNWESVYLFQVLKIILVDLGASLEAAVFWHFHIHGAHVLLTVVLTFLPQRAKTSKRQAPRLKEDKGHN